MFLMKFLFFESAKLTDSIDVQTGTSGDDVIVGDDNTASSADQLNGLGGEDEVRLFDTNTIPQLDSIEIATFNSVDNTDGDIDTTNRDSLTTVVHEDVTLAGNQGVTLANEESLTLRNAEGDGSNLEISSTLANETITLDDVGQESSLGDTTLDLAGSSEDITDLTLKTENRGAAVALADSDAALETLNLEGTQDLDVTNMSISSLTTVDATGMSTPEGGSSVAGATVTFAAAADFTFTGGTGNDTVNAAGNFDTNDSLDGGDGQQDAVNFVQNGAIAGDLDITNFEVVGVDESITSNRTIDLDNVEGLVAVGVGGSNSLGDSDSVHTLQDIATSATTIEFRGTGKDEDQAFDGVELDFDTTQDVASVSVNIANMGTEGQNFQIQDLVLDGVENVSITASDIGVDPTTSESLDFTNQIDADAATSISLEANGQVNFTSGINTGAGGDDVLETLDVSNANGVDLGTVTDFADDADVTLSDGNDTLVQGDTEILVVEGGDGADFINVAGDENEITTGGGSDTVVLSIDHNSGSNNEIQAAGTQEDNTIQDFTTGAGGDVLSFDPNGSSTAAGVTSTNTFSAIDLQNSSATTGFAADNGSALSDLQESTIAGALNDVASNEDTFMAAVTDGSNTAIALVADRADGAGTETASDVGIQADEVEVVATLQGVSDPTDLSAENFANFLA